MAAAPLAGGTTVRTDSSTRADGIGGRWVNPAIGLGGIADPIARTIFTTPTAIPQTMVDALLQFDGLAHRLASREPYDCTREGFSLGPDPDAERLRVAAMKSITGRTPVDVDEPIGVLDLVKRARTWARAYGGAAIVMMIDDGREAREPLDRTGIRSIDGARVLNRWEVSPIAWDQDPRSIRLGRPTMYNVTIGASPFTVHHSRVVIFQGVELPDQVMRRQNGWGGSVFDLAFASMVSFKVAQRLLPNMVRRMTQGVRKMDRLETGIAGGVKASMIERFEAQQAAMGVLGDIAIGAGDDYEILTRPISGIGEALEGIERGLVADCDGLPKLLLFADTPGGIRNGDSPEVVAWYDNCASRQPTHYSPPTMRLLELLALAHDGPTGGRVPAMDLRWHPLYQPSPTEQASVDLSRAQRRQIDLTSGSVTSAEVATDPDLARHYTLASERPAVAGIEPEVDEDEQLDDEAESIPVVSADLASVPEDEQLISVVAAARRLGFSTAAPLMRMGAAGMFPIFRVGGRWRVAWSHVRDRGVQTLAAGSVSSRGPGDAPTATA